MFTAKIETGTRCGVEMRDDKPVESTNELLEDLDARGLIHDSTDREALAARLNAGSVTLYCGFDPTADSLHVGHLLGIIGLRRFGDAGHRPLALVGGATGMVGDPSGRSDERNLLDADDLAHNKEAIAAQITRVMGDESRWEMVDNADWTVPVSLLDFLRDVGKHVTVNQMIARESVSARLQSENGISFTEFSYQLLQAHDFWWLHANRGCELQVGGSDQWGNIVAGTDLIRRRGGGTAHALTWPLLLRSDGTKFGKSASGENVWLDPQRTSPYKFFQFWMHAQDTEVERLLKQLTLVSIDEIAVVLAQHAQAPHQRVAQKRLAHEVTNLVHGPVATEQAKEASQVLFGGDVTGTQPETLATLIDEIPTLRITMAEIDGLELLDALVRSGLCASRSEARRAVEQGGAYCNDGRVLTDETFTRDKLLHDRFALLRKGRKAYALLVADEK